ncbi:hypothetical protein H5410_032902 [Solanum commersonii]|uniref:Myosin motor domain-containing protein n=1 Tax=Solanum commersonii TaxID=4109 RepID=A0A9J5YR00_SOLCO|nr:hypothetical protein H5410_032902 [Solanum commersonii]
MNTKVTQVVIGLERVIGPRTSNRARLIWDSGRVVDVRMVQSKGAAASLRNTGCLFLPSILMKKLSLRFWKPTDAKCPVVDVQITRILALLQKIEDKYSFVSVQYLVEDAGISVATILNNEIASPLAEENSSRVDNVESHPELFGISIVEHSSLGDNLSTRVFTKEVQETSSASRFVADLEDIQPLKSLNKFFHSCCPKVVAEVQSETPIKRLDEESVGPERSEEMSKMYNTTATSLDHSSSKHKAFETFGDKYLPNNMPSNEMMLVVERGISTKEFSAHNILCQFSFNPNMNSSIVFVHGTVTNRCVWDPGISFNFMDPTGYTYTTNVNPSQLLGYTNKFCFIAYANFLTQVWDLGQQSVAKWDVADEMVMMESEVHDIYSELCKSCVTGDTCTLDIICLPKLFQFLQRLLAQLTRGLQGCIKSMMKLIEHLLRNFSTLEDITIFFGAQGVLASYATGPTLKFEHILVGYGADEFIILIMHDTLELACENNHRNLAMMYSEVELVKGASIADAYVVHKSVLVESKNTSILVSCGKFKTITRLMCYLSHFGGHRSVEERTVAQQIQLAELGKASGAAMRTSLLASSRALLVIILEHKHHYLFLLCETPMEVNKKCRLRDPESFFYLRQSYCYKIACITSAQNSVNIKERMTSVWLGKREQMIFFRIVASVMILGNMEFSEGNEIVSSILQVDSVWFQLRTTIAALYTHSSLGRFNIILSVTQVVIGLERAIGLRTSNRARLIWDPGRVVDVRMVPSKGAAVTDLGMMSIEENDCPLLFF